MIILILPKADSNSKLVLLSKPPPGDNGKTKVNEPFALAMQMMNLKR